ncbi:MAG: hypothetical protein C4297_05040 [Gemmataceae bacterium]
MTSNIPDWAAALGRIPSGLFILSARKERQETGVLVSWVQQCSFQPPLVTLALKRGRYIADWLRSGAAGTLNILDESQTNMISHFGRGFDPDEDAFCELNVIRREAQATILAEAVAYLDVRPEQHIPAGDHDLFLMRVLDGRVLSTGRPMVHIRKSGLHY